ncbi:rab11 family-interacting protein 2 isoform X2 [Cephus cinctus]|nr:rab11 family-interacting protein 2 isoform X2 [Cephus cinctus]XP_024943093.1 rab11 family-interacting protein 2 isoform X2 [Cephus cinctus]
MIAIPLSSFDVYERPKNRWYTLGSKPGKGNTKERGELEVKIGFIVKAGSLTDLTRKEKHKSSLGQLSTAAQSIGGSLLSIGSLEKRKGLKKFAKSIGNKVKGKSKSRLDKDGLDEKEEHHIQPSRQEPGEADPGVISEDEDEFTFDDLSHKSSASSLNAPTANNANSQPVANTISSSVSSHTLDSQTPPPVPTNSAPNKPPRFAMPSANTLPRTMEHQEDEWGQKLYGKQGSNTLKRWEDKPRPRIVLDEVKGEYDTTPSPPTPSSIIRSRDTPEPPSPAPREIIFPKNNKDDRIKDKKEEKIMRSPKEEKLSKKDKKKEKEQKLKESRDEGHSSSERIIIGEDSAKSGSNSRSRLPHEILAQFEGKSREDLIELALHLQSEVTDKKKRLADLEEYIDALLLRVIESSPRLLQNPYQSQRRLSSPGHQ